MSDNHAPYEKECNKCHQRIIMRYVQGAWHPFNLDNTPHTETKAAAPHKEDSRIGIYGGVVRGRISLTLKNGIMMSEATEDLLKCLNDPNTAAKSGMKVKLIFGKDGKAVKLEPCPDQPAAHQQAPGEEPPAQPAPHQDIRTSPESDAPQKPEKIGREALISMVCSPDTYWKAKALMDIEAHESICRQTEFKNWAESISLAMQYHGISEIPLDALDPQAPSVFNTATQIHAFIKGKVGGA